MKTLKVTPKIKREIRDLSSLLTLLIATLFLLASLTSCNKEKLPDDCGTYATVKDLRGLDGCGFVFELDNGEKLEPRRAHSFCGTPPLPVSALDNFEFVDGQRVTIGYKELEGQASICMVGKVVEVTCIDKVTVAQE